MNRRQKIIVSVVGIFIVLLALVGLTYAYFLTQIKGNTNNKSISVTTANLRLVYGGDDGSIIGDDEIIEPDTTFAPKTFTVTNEGNETIDSYAVVIENFGVYYNEDSTIINENNVEVPVYANDVTSLSRPEDFEIVITCKNQDNEDCTGYSGALPTESAIMLTNSIEVEETQTYKATITYKEAGTNQSADMNKRIEGKFNIIGLSDTVDLTGKVSGYSEGDFVQTNSTKRVSTINPDGTYKVLGLETGTHKIKVCAADPEHPEVKDCADEDAKLIQEINIVKGETASGNNSTKTITITEAARLATVNINVNEKSLTIENNIVEEEINWNNAPSGTLLNALKNNNEVTSGIPSPSDLIDYKIKKENNYGISTSNLTINSLNDYVIYADDVDYETASYKSINQCRISSTNCQSAIINKYGIKISQTELSDNELENLTKIKLYDDIFLITKFDSNVLNEFYTEPIFNYWIEPEFEAINKVAAIEDDYGKSYYFRGNGETNYVSFLDKCWRVLRVQGNGKIKLVLDDKEHLCDSSSYKANNGAIGVADYGYIESNGNLTADYLNTENRTTSMKYLLENWYDNNILNNTSLVEKNKWCYQDFNTSAFNLKCYNNEYVESFIGTFTADELGLAVGNYDNISNFVENPYVGGEVLEKIPKDYIYYDTFRTLSKNANYVAPYDQIAGNDASSAQINVIPVITIKSNTPLSTTTTKTQNGTQDNPYVIQ